MPYAALDDVKARIPSQIWSGGPTAQPSEVAVSAWLTATSDWVDSSLRWKYAVPVTDATDLLILQQVVALLAAAQVWDVKASFNPQTGGTISGAGLRKNAYELLAYDAKSGRSNLVLPNTPESDSGEAAGGLADSSFTDPDACGSEPRYFRIGMDF